MMKRLIGYVRVSLGKQAEEGLSLEAQKERIEAYARLHEDRFTLADLVVDAAESAKPGTLDRPALQDALQRIREGRADGILVVKLDRLTRSVRDLDTLLSGDLSGKEIHSLSETLDTSTATGRLLIGILTQVAQWEREVIGERTSAGMAQMKAEGRYTGGRVPYGYKRIGIKLTPDRDEQIVIRRIKALHVAGCTLRQIGRALSDEERKTRSGSEWSPTSIRNILHMDNRMQDRIDALADHLGLPQWAATAELYRDDQRSGNPSDKHVWRLVRGGIQRNTLHHVPEGGPDFTKVWYPSDALDLLEKIWNPTSEEK